MNSATEYPENAGQPWPADQSGPQDQAGQQDQADARPRPPLRRPAGGRMLAGVAAAISRHFNIDVTIVRVAFAVLTIVGFTGLAYLGSLPLYLGGVPLYLACWLLIPEEGSDHSIASNFLASRRSQSR